jgi:multiple sugar transport system permease protein
MTAGVALAIVFIVPIVWSVLRSFQPERLSSSAPQSADFTQMSLTNYSSVSHGTYNILQNLANSLIASIGTAVLAAVIAGLAGYGLAKFKFRGSGIVFSVILVGMMIPFQVILTPLYIELSRLHLINSLLGLVLVYTTYNLPFCVFIMRNSFAAVPNEMMESARVDGAGMFYTLTHVVRPLVVPGLATAAMYAFLMAWTDLLEAMTFIQTNSVLTLPPRLYNITTSTYGALNTSYLASGIVISMIPCVILYLSLQRYYVQGLVSGAVKG